MRDKYNEELKFTDIVEDVKTENRESELNTHPFDLNKIPEEQTMQDVDSSIVTNVKVNKEPDVNVHLLDLNKKIPEEQTMQDFICEMSQIYFPSVSLI